METNIKIENINEIEYKNFLKEFQPISFLQDYEWGEVEKELGREVFRFGIYSESLIGIVQIIGYKAKRGNFLLIPHGPLIKKEYEKNIEYIIKALINKIIDIKLNKKYIFLRLNSSFLENEISLKNFQKLGFTLAPIWTVSENLFIKKIDKSDDELLNEMDKSHKKLILESLDKDYLVIEETKDMNKLEIFLNIYKNLANRKNFIPYPDELIKKEFEIFSRENKASLYLGNIENQYYCGALIIYSHNSAYYHHGASVPIKEPINYKLHWKIILNSRKRGCKYYNMWGITLSNNKKHPWYGLTQFKKGFGGNLIKFLPTLDYKFSFKYYLTYSYEKLKKIKKKL